MLLRVQLNRPFGGFVCWKNIPGKRATIKSKIERLKARSNNFKREKDWTCRPAFKEEVPSVDHRPEYPYYTITQRRVLWEKVIFFLRKWIRKSPHLGTKVDKISFIHLKWKLGVDGESNVDKRWSTRMTICLFVSVFVLVFIFEFVLLFIFVFVCVLVYLSPLRLLICICLH